MKGIFLISASFVFLLVFLFFTQASQAQSCDPVRCSGVPLGGSCSGGGPNCVQNCSGGPPGSCLFCTCSGSGGGGGTPTPPPAPIPTSTPVPTLPVGCPGGYSCVSSCSTGNTAPAGQACINYMGSSAICCGPGAPAPTSAPPPPSEYCGNTSCRLDLGENCSNCPSDCGSCGPIACGGGSYVACGGGYCCNGEVCTTGGCCPAGNPYVCDGYCSPTPCSAPAPVVCPDVGWGSSPGSYCGSACVSCGVTSDRYYDASCNCVTTWTSSYNPSWCQIPSLCGGGPAPTSAPPAPTSPPSAPTSAPPAPTSPPSVGGCPVGLYPTQICSNFACVPGGCGTSSQCGDSTDCSCGNGICESWESSSTCIADCTYDIEVNVFKDLNKDGTWTTGCRRGQTGCEPLYTDSSVAIDLNPNPNSNSGFPEYTSTGRYTFRNLPRGAYSVALSGFGLSYQVGGSNPISIPLLAADTQVNFPLVDAPPFCGDNPDATPSTVEPGGTSTVDVEICRNVAPTPSDGYDWEPSSPGDPSRCSTGTVTDVVSTSNASTATWTAPLCPGNSDIVCRPRVTVSGPGGSTSYSTPNITVRRSGEIRAYVHDVSNGEACNSSAPAYTGAVNWELTGPSGRINTPPTRLGSAYIFSCLLDGTYSLALREPDGYQMSTGNNSQSVNINNSTQTVRFCISSYEPWFQTEHGDVRMRGIVNPIPEGSVGSLGNTQGSVGPLGDSPGIFFSTQFNREESDGDLSPKGWLVNREYSYNALTQNRNGTLAYSFYKSRARQEGIEIKELDAETLNNTPIIESGVYEVNGDLTIGEDYSPVGGTRVVLLVNGRVTINSEIHVPLESLFILASTDNIEISEEVGEDLPASEASNLEGYYSSEKDIIIKGNDCNGGVPDKRLNVGGALIAHALKPFSSSGGGMIVNNRSLCSADNTNPSLYVSSRLDFLTTLTDFYKVSYTKWREKTP